MKKDYLPLMHKYLHRNFLGSVVLGQKNSIVTQSKTVRAMVKNITSITGFCPAIGTVKHHSVSERRFRALSDCEIRSLVQLFRLVSRFLKVVPPPSRDEGVAKNDVGSSVLLP